jgi:CRISPR/Cas system-associated exonuclease Cas4 (RecB family)
MMAAPSPVIGEVKTGKSLRDFHLTTVAGYALAYESQHNQDVDFGILYFLETHSTQLSFAGSRPFVIDDLLRKQFLKKRNDLYAILAKGDEPSLVDPKYYEDFCFHCKYHAHCYP